MGPHVPPLNHAFLRRSFLYPEPSRVALVCMVGSQGREGFHGRTAEHRSCMHSLESNCIRHLSSLTRVSMPAAAAHVGRFLVRLTPIHFSPPPLPILARHRLGLNPSVSLPKLVVYCHWPPPCLAIIITESSTCSGPSRRRSGPGSSEKSVHRRRTSTRSTPGARNGRETTVE